MNIKEHIEAGHYPKDSKGRALVPYKDGGTVVVCATDMPGRCPILGFRVDSTGNREDQTLADTGWGYFPDSPFLLPPPPRKVKVTAWASVLGDTINKMHFHKHFAEQDVRESKEVNGGTYCLVELTGEYEEPWS